MFNRIKEVLSVLVFICVCFQSVDAFIDTETKYNIPVSIEKDAFEVPSFANDLDGENIEHFVNYPSLVDSQFEPEPPATGDIPTEEMEYMFRVYATNCSCPQKKKQRDVADKMSKRSQHLPFGVPYSPEDNVTLRLLYNDDYITAFDLKYRIPMWTSFTIDEKKSISQSDDVCWTGDARIAFSDTAQCGDYDTSIVKKQNILQRPLFPPDFSDSSTVDQATYITNSIPKSLNHTKHLEKEVYQVLGNWAEDGQLNVLMGPAFDLDGTGIRPHIGTIMRTHAIHGPLIVPTHIFVVATWCSDRNENTYVCDSSKLMVHGFLFPNKPFEGNTEPVANILEKSTTSIANIEKLTGLSFYTGLPTQDAARLRTMPSEKYVSKVK